MIRPASAAGKHFSVSNGASFATDQVAPGSLGTAFVETGVSQTVNASIFSVPLPTILGGVTLSIGGSLNFDTPSNGWVYSSTGSVLAPLHFVGPNQVNFQVPTGLALGSVVPAQLTKPDASTLLGMVNITAAAPGIFSVSRDGRFQAAVLNQDNSQNGNPETILGARPAVRGSVIQICATGAGETAPASGNPLILTKVQPDVLIGGKVPRVLFSGLAPGWVGLWQINAEVPQDVTPGSAVPLVVDAVGPNSNTVTIAVQ